MLCKTSFVDTPAPCNIAVCCKLAQMGHAQTPACTCAQSCTLHMSERAPLAFSAFSCRSSPWPSRGMRPLCEVSSTAKPLSTSKELARSPRPPRPPVMKNHLNSPAGPTEANRQQHAIEGACGRRCAAPHATPPLRHRRTHQAPGYIRFPHYPPPNRPLEEMDAPCALCTGTMRSRVERRPQLV